MMCHTDIKGIPFSENVCIWIKPKGFFFKIHFSQAGFNLMFCFGALLQAAMKVGITVEVRKICSPLLIVTFQGMHKCHKGESHCSDITLKAPGNY